MMDDINEIKVDTQLLKLATEIESLKSKLSSIGLKKAADSKAHKLELSSLQEEKARLLEENEKLGTKVETLTLGLNSAEESAKYTRRQLDQVRRILYQ